LSFWGTFPFGSHRGIDPSTQATYALNSGVWQIPKNLFGMPSA
jgi:hypothetical protein